MFPALPWWAFLYLAIVLIANVGGAAEDYQRSKSMAFAHILSFSFVCVFVTGYFYPDTIAFLGFALFPMVIGGLLWEFFSAMIDAQKGRVMLENEIDLDEQDKQGIMDVAMIVNALIVLPGYIIGLKLCVDMVMG